MRACALKTMKCNNQNTSKFGFVRRVEADAEFKTDKLSCLWQDESKILGCMF